MDSIENRKREERFVNAWKRWVQRPPRQSPQEAAARVVGRLPRRASSQPWRLLAAAVVLLAVALAVNWAVVSRRVPQAGAGNGNYESPPMGGGEVLIWLDDKTPLYMTFQPPEETAAAQNKS